MARYILTQTSLDRLTERVTEERLAQWQIELINEMNYHINRIRKQENEI